MDMVLEKPLFILLFGRTQIEGGRTQHFLKRHVLKNSRKALLQVRDLLTPSFADLDKENITDNRFHIQWFGQF